MNLVERMSPPAFAAALAMALGVTAANEAGAKVRGPDSIPAMPAVAGGSVPVTYALGAGKQAQANVEGVQFRHRGWDRRRGWDQPRRLARPRGGMGAWQRGWAHRWGYGASWGWGWRPWGWSVRPWAWNVHYTPWGWRGRVWW